ncbi:glycosyltransferase [Catenuloplanes atrovinosus]|uniref:UDP:flavonoid glycosyltransferase YjiC (YdhE family) n=1 Tax=Catenuloplanes atrovinosus TaxID=137266 RepID=A0AAE3YWG3_9ACTN|nr:glycosyltransferase [Catenuloplanes atrovinosus]MDR7279579.1 UDP:flavonoid glycosyltransferase YjiC (YdhE family) [Catenuloplanes atrovinosus]
MRILFSFVGGAGHFLPLTPIARAARAAGHDVALSAGPRMVDTVRRAGFEVLDNGAADAPTPERRERLPLAPLDEARERRVVTDMFVRKAGPDRAARLLTQAAEWRPDLIVCDEVDYGAMIAAERLGIPHATVVVLAAGSFVQDGYVAEAIDEVRAEFGLPPDGGLAMLGRHLVLEPVPPGFRDPAFPLPATGHAIRPAETMPPIAEGGDRPLIYFTLGTEFNIESGDLFERVLAGLRDLPADLVMTVGRHLDPAVFGPQPAHVRIERFVPQDELLPRCDLVVSHGGSGSVLGAVAHGLPMLVAPMGADQPDNAVRVAALGLGRVLDAETVTPERAAAEAAAVLAGPGCRDTARALRAGWAALPGPAAAVRLLESIA